VEFRPTHTHPLFIEELVATKRSVQRLGRDKNLRVSILFSLRYWLQLNKVLEEMSVKGWDSFHPLFIEVLVATNRENGKRRKKES
jgi:hypothetical protein